MRLQAAGEDGILGTPDDETDPDSADSDGDTLADGCEDDDRDCILDAGESSATLADTDGDGLAAGTDPNDPTSFPATPLVDLLRNAQAPSLEAAPALYPGIIFNLLPAGGLNPANATVTTEVTSPWTLAGEAAGGRPIVFYELTEPALVLRVARSGDDVVLSW